MRMQERWEREDEELIDKKDAVIDLFEAVEGIRGLVRSRGLGGVY